MNDIFILKTEEFLKKTFTPFNKKNLFKNFENIGYSLIKTFPTQQGIDSYIFYSKESFAHYAFAFVKDNYFLIVVNLTGKSNNLLLATITNIELLNLEVYKSRLNKESLWNFLSALKRNVSTEIPSKENIDTLYETTAPIRSLFNGGKITSELSVIYYQHASLKKYLIAKIGDKKEFSLLSEKRKRRLKITMVKNFWRKNFIYGYPRWGENKEWSGSNLTFVYKNLFIKEIYISLNTDFIRMRYSFKENEFEDFLEDFFYSFNSISKEVINNDFIKKIISKSYFSNYINIEKSIKDFNSYKFKFINQRLKYDR